MIGQWSGIKVLSTQPFSSIQDNWSALLYSAKEGHLEIVIELLERGADIEHKDLVKKIGTNIQKMFKKFLDIENKMINSGAKLSKNKILLEQI